MLRRIEVAITNGKTTPAACQEKAITELLYHWRKEHSGLRAVQIKRLKELEQKNSSPSFPFPGEHCLGMMR
jgi:hypothetical protein